MPRLTAPIHRTALAAAAVLVTALAGAVSSSAAGRLSAPVVREHFTALPCTGSPAHRTTLAQEGCAERSVRRGDAQINGLNGKIFSTLSSTAARRQFISANSDWLRYRAAVCFSAGDRFSGGSQAPVAYALCLVTRNGQHVTDLRSLLREASGQNAS